MFSTLSKTEIIIYVAFTLSSANALNLDKVKFLSSGNGLTVYDTDKFEVSSNSKRNDAKHKNIEICFGKGRYTDRHEMRSKLFNNTFLHSPAF